MHYKIKELHILITTLKNEEGLSDYGVTLLEGYAVGLETVVKNCSIPAVINCVAVPEWLTDEIRVLAKTTWNAHKDFNYNKRVEAMRIIKRCALAAGYTITIKKATELLQQHCL